jgi:hypothetical protein
MRDYAYVVVSEGRELQRPVVLVGWSMGGLVALMAVGELEPDVLILLEPSPPEDVQGSDPEAPLDEGTFDPEDVYGDFPKGVPARLESSHARGERKRGISVSVPSCPAIVISGSERRSAAGQWRTIWGLATHVPASILGAGHRRARGRCHRGGAPHLTVEASPGGCQAVVMRRLAVLTTCVALGLGVSPYAAAKESVHAIEGRYSVLHAGMYATVLDGGDRPIQVYRRLCPEPGRKAGCERIIVSLREAIEDAVRRPIRWVGKERRHGGLFWQLGPIEREHAHAAFDYRWDDPRPYGCTGGGTAEFERRDQAWYPTGGGGFVGCP